MGNTETAKISTPQAVVAISNQEDDSSKYFGDSKTLRSPAHRKIVMKFVRDNHPKARFHRKFMMLPHMGGRKMIFINAAITKDGR